MIKTLSEFLDFCRAADNDMIYEAFENNCTEEVRDCIYGYSDPESPEPFRSAMHRFGFFNF